MTNGDGEPPNSSSLHAEVESLQEENARLRSLLIAHGIPISEVPAFGSETIQVSSSAPEVQRPGVATAEQRIALFRSLFRGREDVYAIRWESSDGRSGYMPKADRDWKSYLNAKEQDRKKIDRQTRSYRPLTDDVLRGHLIGDQTVASALGKSDPPVLVRSDPGQEQHLER